MTTTLTAITRSGSNYTLDHQGVMRVTRRPGHPLPEHETLTIDTIERLAGPKGTTLLFVRPLGEESFVTSSLAAASLPVCLRKVGGRWVREDQVAKADEPSKALDSIPCDWVPTPAKLPEGLLAALAVYGD